MYGEMKCEPAAIAAAEAIVSRLSELTAKVEMGGEDRRLSPNRYG